MFGRGCPTRTTYHSGTATLEKKFGDRYVWQATGSMPPDELITTEALMRQTDLEYRRRPGWYFTTGCRAARGIIEILEQHSFDLHILKSLLEFGCGSARVLHQTLTAIS